MDPNGREVVAVPGLEVRGARGGQALVRLRRWTHGLPALRHGPYRAHRVTLALGLVASVPLIAATTEFHGKIGPVEFHKGKADVETVKAVIGGVFGVLKLSAS